MTKLETVPQTSPPGARERAKQDKLARLTAAAKQLFSEQGFERTTTQQIASQAGVAAGTLFLYAPTKEDLLILVFVDEISAVFDEAVRTLPNGGVVDRANHLLQRLLNYNARDLDLSRRMMKGLVFVHNDQTRGPALAITSTVLKALADIMAQGQETGEVRADLEPMEAAGYLFAVYMSAAGRLFSGMDDFGTVKAFLDRGTRLLMEGMASDGAFSADVAAGGPRNPAKLGYQMTRLKRRLRSVR